MTGETHAGLGVAVGLVQAASSHAGLIPGVVEIVLALIAALLPDIDRSTSLFGRLVPQTIARDEVRQLGGRVRSWRWVGPFAVAHHGATHSLFVGGVLALPWLLAGHSEYARAFYQGWLSHLAADGGSKQELLWPVSLVLPYPLRWIQLAPSILRSRLMDGAALGAAGVVVLATLTGRLWG